MISPIGGFRNKLIWLGIFLLITLPVCFAQSTTVTMTVVDSSSQVWANGTVSYIFQGNGVFNGQYQWNGANLPAQYLVKTTVSLDGSGSATIVLPSSTAITPAGSSWLFTFNPNATSTGRSIPIAVTGTSEDISSIVTPQLPQTQVKPLQTPFSYQDGDILSSLIIGNTYYNTTLNCLRTYFNTGWACITGGGGGTPCVDTDGSIQYNNSGAFGCSPLIWDSTNGDWNTGTSTSPSGDFQLWAAGEDGIWFCTDPAQPVAECPASSGGGDVRLYSGTDILSQAQGLNRMVSLGGDVTIDSIFGNVNITSDLFTSVVSEGGITFQDTSSNGITIQELMSGQIVNLEADVPADIQANGSQICTFANPCGGGGGGISGLTAGYSPLAGSATTITADSHMNELTPGITLDTQKFGATSLLGASPSSAAQAALPSGANGYAGDETSTVGVPAAGVDYIRPDSINHCFEMSLNNGAESCLGSSGLPSQAATITSSSPGDFSAACTSSSCTSLSGIVRITMINPLTNPAYSVSFASPESCFYRGNMISSGSINTWNPLNASVLSSGSSFTMIITGGFTTSDTIDTEYTCTQH